MSKNDWLETATDLSRVAGRAARRLFLEAGRLGEELNYDVAAFRQRDPAAKSDAEIVLLYAGFHARFFHRLSHALYKKGHSFAARAVSQGARMLTGIEIHPGAEIGRGLVIDHGAGVVIGETAEIGDDCTLYQGVTLGGTGKDVGKRHPTLENGVMVGAGAKVLGPLTIGEGAKIAAGAVVLSDIPAGATAVGIPAHVVRVDGHRVSDPLDQIHIPDPMEDEACDLRRCVTELSARLAALEAQKKTGKAAPGTVRKTKPKEKEA